MTFIQIIEDEPFDWRYRDDETGQLSDSVFTLRRLSDDRITALTKAHTTTRPVFNKKTRGMDKSEDFDGTGYVNDVIDEAIVGWTGVRKVGADVDLPCERKYKVLLPNRVRLEIVRVVAGGEFADVEVRHETEEASKNA